MWTRCTNPKADNYPYYGGRGIKVCQRWESFALFVKDMGERPPGKTLDRINPDKEYAPYNCRWATRVEQAQNQRGTKLTPQAVAAIRKLHAEGTSKQVLADMYGVSRRQVSNVVRGVQWNPDR